MGVPLVIFALCLCVGAVLSSKWLPDLDAGSIGGLAFFSVCGLLGLALALLGEHIYLIVNEVEHISGQGAVSKGEVVGGGLKNIALDVGTVVGLALVVYLLAPRVAGDAKLADASIDAP